jgi:hypothetical protein
MKTVSANFKKLALSCIIMIVAGASFAQGLLDSLSQDDSKIISSIAPYATDMRSAILDVSQYPQALVKLERTQARTSQSFQDLIERYRREEQEKFYQAARFPELTDKLVSGGRKSADDVKSLLKDYPENIQQQITALYNEHFEALVKMNDIYQSSQKALEKITARYPALVQDHFKKVVANPDVMNLLTDNIDLTVSLGEAYKNDPTAITGQLDDMNKQLTAQNEKDLNDYKAAVDKDPALQAEMKKAADEFAKQYDQGNTNPTYVTNNYYDNYPYTYWYGYPYWYTSAMWYPTPFYYQTGFYYGPGGRLVIAGLPSPFYANWFFGFGYSRYPSLYRHYNTYYNLHRTEIINRNIYHGFNGAARNHFLTVNRSTAAHRGTLVRHSEGISPGRYNSHISQMNVKPGNFNNNGFDHYHATNFHSAGWQHIHTGGFRGRR